MDQASPYLKLVGRVLLALIFLQAGFNKIPGYAETAGFMESKGIPGLLLPLVILVELGGGLLVLLGLWTRWAALAPAGFCVLAAILFHWEPGNQMQMISFMKNLTIAGGFLVLAGTTPGAFALDNRRS